MKIQKIDMHVHIQEGGGPERLRGGTWPTASEVREVYNELNVEKGVQMSRVAPERMHDPITSRDCQRLWENHPETIGWWFCALDPRMANNTGDDDLSYYLDFFKERGARGVGELQANIYIDDKRMLNLFYHCEKSDMPVTIHFGKLGDDCGVADDLGLVRLEKVLDMFPKLKILGHAAPFWAEISADASEENRTEYPKGKVTEGRISKLLRKYPNLYCDISANSGLNAFVRDEEFAYKFIEEFHERILFATDISSPASLQGTGRKISDFFDNGYEKGNINLTSYKNICRENALRLLGGTK